jgi:uncharacterized protein (DUF1697 family)
MRAGVRAKAKARAQPKAKSTGKPRAKPEKQTRGGEQVFVVLLRGINVGGQKRVPMQELCALASEARCSGVLSYIQSGNLVLARRSTASALEAALERSIASHFGFEVEVIVRRAEDWLVYAHGTPFPAVAAERPHLLLLGLAKRPLAPGAAEAIRARAQAGERVEVVGDALWIDYGGGVARSKLTPAVLDRAAGSTVTARNWRTVQKLAEMVQNFRSS